MKLFLSPSGEQLTATPGQVLVCIDGEEWEGRDATSGLPDGTHAFQVVAWDTGANAYLPKDRIHVNDVRTPTAADQLAFTADLATHTMNGGEAGGHAFGGTEYSFGHAGGGETSLYMAVGGSFLSPPAGPPAGIAVVATNRTVFGGFLSFFDAPLVQQQTITGSRTDGTALADLLTKLALMGLIV